MSAGKNEASRKGLDRWRQDDRLIPRKIMEWYYAKHGKQEGPVPVERLRAMIASGEVGPSDLVWREGMPEWIPAARATELSSPGSVDSSPPDEGQQVTPAGVAQPGYEPPLSPHAGQHVPNYLVPSILVTVFCCQPLGIPAIVFAAQVDGLVARGDMAGAMQASKKARMWTWISFGTGLGLVLLYVLFIAVAGASGI